MTIDLSGGYGMNAPRSFEKNSTGLRPLHILLVDDDELVRAGTVEMLAEAGHEVIEAASGTEALAIFEADKRIELLITDNLMPGMMGSDLIAGCGGMRRGYRSCWLPAMPAATMILPPTLGCSPSRSAKRACERRSMI